MKYSTKTKRFVHWAIGGLASCFLAVTALGQTNFTQATSITINDNSKATPYPSPNVVQNTIGTLEKVTVTLNGVSHTNPDDIDMALVGPDGTSVMLMSDAGGQFDLVNTTFTLDSSAGTDLPDEALINSATYRPKNYDGGDGDTFFGGPPTPVPSASDLSVFNGKTGTAVNGTWNLYVVDDTVIDAGSIRSWSLNLYMSPTLQTTNTVAMTEDTPVTVNVFVNDTDTPLSSLNLTATSSDQSIIKDSDLANAFGGDRTGTNRTLTITPVANANGGPVTITVTAKDEQGQVIPGVNQQTFTVNVAAVPDAPTFVSVGTSSTSIPQGGISTNIFLKVGDVDSATTDLILTATSSNPSVIPATNVLFGRVDTGGANRVLQIAASDTVGTATLTIVVTDPGGKSSSTTIAATVTSVSSIVKANPATISVPDTGDGSASPYPSIITIPNSNGLGLVGKAVVSLINVEAADPSDLGVLLVSPSGRSVLLMRNAGDDLPIGLGDTNDVRLTFDVDALNSIGSSQLTTSTNRPSDLASADGDFPGTAPAGSYSVDLDSLRGTAANGDWKLYVYDAATGNSATAKIAGGWVLQIFPAPTIATIPNQTTSEDTPLTVSFQVGDLDGSVTNITTQFDPSKLAITISPSVTGNTGTLLITPAANFYTAPSGVPITVVAKDNSGFTVTTTFNLTVTPVNDAPTQTVIPKQIARAGQSVGPVSFTVGDIETIPANLVVSAISDNPKLLPPGAIILGTLPSDPSGATRTITLFPAGAQGGTATITVTVTDNGVGSPTATPASSSQTFNLTVNEAANPLYENTTGIAINDATGTVGTPIPGQATPYPSTISVSGLVGTIAEVQVTLYGITHETPGDLDIMLVGPGASPKSIILISDVGDDNSLTNVTLRFRQSASTPITDFGNQQIVSGDYQPGNIGLGDFPVGSSPTDNATSLNEYNGTSPNGDWKLYVVDDSPTAGVTTKQLISSWQLSIRTQPVFAPIPDQTTAENTPLRLTVSLGDNQPGVPFTVTTAVSGTPNAIASITPSSGSTVFGGSQTFTITPIPNTDGLNKVTNQVTLTFTHSGDASVSQSFNLIVLPVDEAPVFGAISDQTTQAATPTSFTFTVTDPEGTAVDVTPSSSNQDIVADSGIVISPKSSTTATRTITITPNAIANGSVTITLVATDATGQKSTKTFSLVVSPNVSFSNNGAPITIIDNAPANPYPSTIDVSGVNGTVSGASVVLLGFTHVFPDDVDVLLVAPDGTHSVMLMSDAGGGNSVSNYRLTFAMGNPVVPDASPLVNGAVYSPANYTDSLETGEMPSPAPAPNLTTFPNGGYSVDLNSLAGVNPNGQWKLFVRDDTFPDGGSISGGWILLLQTAPTITGSDPAPTPEHTTTSIRFSVSDQDSVTGSNPSDLRLQKPTFTVGTGNLPLDASQFTLVTNTISAPFANYTLTIPALSLNPGTVTLSNSVTVTVTDGTSTATKAFEVVVTPVDDAPTITGAFEPSATFTYATNLVVTGQTTTSPSVSNPVTITFKVKDADSQLGTSTNVVVQSSNTALLPLNSANIAISGPDNVAPNTEFIVTVTLTPAANQSGTNVLNFLVSDRSQTTTNTVTLVVTNINNLPTISFPALTSTAPNATVVAGGTISNFPITVGDVETSPRNIVVTASSSNTNLIPNENIVLGGSSADRTLTLTSVGTGTGDVTISVIATDENGGATTKTFIVSISPSPSSIFGNSAAILIPGTGTVGNASPYPSLINVAGLNGTISKISVTIDGLTHTAPDDIDILLVSPSGKKSILISDVGGANPVSNVRLVFDQSGRGLSDDSQIVSGTYQPTDFEVGSDTFPSAPAGPYPTSLQEFIGTDPNGNWNLYVVDDATGNSGQIQFGWSLRIETAPTVVLGANVLNAPSGTPTYLEFPEDTSHDISFTIGDSAGTAPANLAVSFSSSNGSLLPASNIVTSLSGNIVTATLDPVPNGFGTNNLTITVRRSDGAQSSIVVPMNITPVNDLPTISRLSDRTTSSDTPISIPVLITDVDTPLSQIWIKATSGNEAVVSSTNILIAGRTNFLKGITGNQSSPLAFPVGTLDSWTNLITIVPNTAASSGTAFPITIQVQEVDGSGNVQNTVSSAFNLTVSPVNHKPTITGANGNPIASVISVEAGKSTANIPFTVGDPDNDSLTITKSSSDQSLVRDSDIVIDVPSGLAGAVGSDGGNRHVRVTTQPGVQGDALITLTVKDSGNASAVTQFTVRVIPTRERVFANNHPITIRDNNSADPYPSQISVDGFSGSISKVTVTLNGFWHTFPDDVDMILVSPTGKKSYIMSDAGGGNSIPSSAAINIKFDDTDPDAIPVPDNSQITARTYKVTNYDTGTDEFVNRTPTAGLPTAPAGPYAEALSTFNGDSPNGVWSLYVVDDTLQDGGAITNGWSLGITTLPVLAGLQDVTSQEDVPASTPFTIAEESFANPTAFTFSVTSTNTALVPSSTNNIVISGTGTNRTVTVIPTANASGTTLITITEQGSGISGQFHATFTPINDPPIITQVADQTVPVGGFITITNFNYSDVETPKKDLVFTIDSSDPGAIPTNNVVLVGSDLRIFSDTRAGLSRITITVTDTGDGVNPPASASMSFVVTVSPGQNAVFANNDGVAIPEQGIATPYPSTIEVRGVVGAVAKVTATLRGLTHPFPDDVDILLVGPNGNGVVLMSDAGAGGNPLTALTNAWLTFDDSATQNLPDNSGIQPFNTYKPTDYEVSNSEFPSPAPAGPYSATFSAAFNGSIPNGTWSLYVQDDQKPDAGHLSGWTLSITTTAPTISAIPDQILDEDTPKTVDFTVTDANTAASNLVVTATLLVDDRGPLLDSARQPDGSFQIPITGTDTNKSITLTPALHVTGTTRVIVSVTDGTYTNQSSFNVVIAPVNHFPVITGLGDTNTPVNVRLRINFTASDVETAASNLVITATTSNDAAGSLTLDRTGANPSLVFNPAGIANTNTTVTVVVSDGTLSTTNSFVIAVTPAIGPTISAIPNQTIDENTSVQVAFTISSPSTNVTVTAQATNPRLVSNVAVSSEGNNRTALITLVPDQSGFSEIDITVTDDFGSATAAFGLFVRKVQQPVRLGPIDDVTTTKNSAVQIVLPLINPDGQELTSLLFSGSASKPTLVSGVTFEQAGINEIATVHLGANQTGLSTVTISVTDGSNTSSSTFALSVIEGDSIPTIQQIGNQIANEDVPLTIALQVSDADTQISDITFSGTSSDTNLVSSITFNNSNGTNSFATNVFMTLNLVTNANGAATITVTAHEGTNTVTQNFVLTVLPVDDVPVLAHITDQIGITNSTILVPVQVTDIDTPISQLNVSGAASNPALVSSVRISNDGTNVSATINLVPNAVGTSSITITVNEGANSVSQSFNLTIRNQAPVPAHLAAARLPNGDINITVTGAVGATYVIQRTSDFVTWTNVGQVTIDADGSVDVSDGTFKPYQFYRAVAQ